MKHGLKHGKDCHKMEHRVHPDDQGYLHGPDDDAPFSVDGQLYCGRCHYAIDSPGEIVDLGEMIDTLVQQLNLKPMTNKQCLTGYALVNALRAQREELRECIAFASVIIRRIGTTDANDPRNIDRAQKWLNLCREMLIKTEPE